MVRPGTRLEDGARAPRVTTVALGLVCAMIGGCGSASTDTRPIDPGPTAATEVAPAATTPPRPEPAPETPPPAPPPVPPSVDPETLPEPARPLALLPRVLAGSGVESLHRSTSRNSAAGPSRTLTATWAVEGEAGWVCLERPEVSPPPPPRCFAMRERYEWASPPRLDREADAVVVRFHRDSAMQWLEVTVPADGPAHGVPRSLRNGGFSPPPYDLPEREPPSLLAALGGMEIAGDGPLLAAVAFDGWTTLCRSDRATCTPPLRLEPLVAYAVSLVTVRAVADDVVQLDVSLEPVANDQQRGRLFLAARGEPEGLVHLATVWTHGRRGRLSGDDLISFEIDSDPPRATASCVHVFDGPSDRVLVTDRGERSTPLPRRPAPDTVPATGVDPYRVNLAGDWTFDPDGGLSRSAEPCTPL